MNQQVLQLLARFIVLLTIPLHEMSHAWVSYKLGDPTAKNAGRLTLNPLKHFDPIGTICMLAFGIGWAKPVPINPLYYRNRKAGMALSAAAGPLSNLLLAYVSLIFYKIVYYHNYFRTATAFSNGAAVVLYFMVLVNLNLAVFNLLPIPPFDGSRVVNLVLPERLYFQVMRYEKYFMLAVLVIVWLGVLDTPLGWLRTQLFSGLSAASTFVDRLCVAGMS